MKFYKIDIKSFYGNRVASDANFIDNSEEVFFKQIALGEIIENISIFNYFFLESYDEKKYWEWALFDVHKFIGESSIMLGSWLVSKKTKELFNKFKISSPHTFYPSKLMYKNKKKDFYIFQFTGKLLYKGIAEQIDFQRSVFLNPITNKNNSFINFDDYTIKNDILYDENEIDFIKQKLVLKKDFDFFPMQSFFTDNLCSEALKQAIEQNNITGFEFSELDYEVVIG